MFDPRANEVGNYGDDRYIAKEEDKYICEMNEGQRKAHQIPLRLVLNLRAALGPVSPTAAQCDGHLLISLLDCPKGG